MKHTLKYRIVCLVVMLFACYTTSLAGKTGRTDSPQKTITDNNRGSGNARNNEDSKEEKEKEPRKASKKKEKNKLKEKKQTKKQKETKDISIAPIVVGQFQGRFQKNFKKLMDQLSQYAITNQAELFCICNYDYYKPEIEHQLNESYQEPPFFIKENKTLRIDCIDVINHALELSGYGQYLWDNIKNLTSNHQICCSVNYYHDRTGEVGFHQDSFGIELFVLLVYLDTVDGPEWQLKPVDDFQERIKEIRMKGLMPEKFIADAEKLYHQLIQDESFEGRDGSIQWPGEIAGPGGIVGFADELIVHSTPYKEHRPDNSGLLLAILAKMEEENRLNNQAIMIVKEQLQSIILKQHLPHYITIDELQRALGAQVYLKEALEEVVKELYKRFGKLESNLRYFKNEITRLEYVVEDLGNWTKIKEQEDRESILDDLYELLDDRINRELNEFKGYLPSDHRWIKRINHLQGLLNIPLNMIPKREVDPAIELINSLYSQLINLPNQLNELYQEVSSKIDTVLGTSNHDIYTDRSIQKSEKYRKHTRSRARRLSQELHNLGNAKRLLQTLESMKEEDAFAAHTQIIELLQKTIELISEKSPLINIDKEQLREEIYSQFEKLEEHSEIVNQMLDRLYRRSFLRVWVTALPKK